MRMLCWILGITLKGKKRSHVIGVACITDKIRGARMRWYGHVQWRDGDHCIKRILETEVHGHRRRGRQRKRWINTISQDFNLIRNSHCSRKNF